MPNIAIFRVSKRKTKGLGLLIILVIGLLFAAFMFGKFTLFSISCIYSQSVRAIHYMNPRMLRIFIRETYPIINTSNNVKMGNPKTFDFNDINCNFLFGELIDYKSYLNTQFPMLKIYANLSPNIIEEKKEEIKKAEDEAETPSKKNTTSSSKIRTQKFDGIIIRNHTKYNIDIERLLREPMKFLGTITKPYQMIILHTHTSEAYTASPKYQYASSEFYRTEDSRYNVVKVGSQLSSELKHYNIQAVHNIKAHDSPTYTGSYKRSLQSAINDLALHPSSKIILDIHRDALGESSEQLRAAANIQGENIARLMFVVGTNEMGLYHPNWQENLKFAIKLQKRANELYPGLCKEIDLRRERFNQHVAPGAIIVEVGGTGNTLDEANESMKYLARVISDVLNDK